MSLSDILSIVAIIISFITFAITTYEQFLKSAKLQLIMGKDIGLSYGYDFSDLVFWSSVAIENRGAVDAVVLGMSGQLTDGQSWTADVEWQALGYFDIIDKKKEGSQPSFIFKDWSETLVASSRKAMTNWISFRIAKLPADNGKPMLLEAQTPYTLHLTVNVPKRRRSLLGSLIRPNAADRAAVSWTGSFTLSESDIDDLKSCVANENGWVDNTVNAELTGKSQWPRPQSPTSSVAANRQIKQVRLPQENSIGSVQSK